jgi:hypothetical protein
MSVPPPPSVIRNGVLGLMSENECSDPQSPSYRNNKSIIEVKCIDIVDIINKYLNAFLVVKLDVEGSEFRILRRLLESGMIQHINHLYVEWHTRYVKGENEQTVNELKAQIIKLGVSLKDWH